VRFEKVNRMFPLYCLRQLIFELELACILIIYFYISLFLTNFLVVLCRKPNASGGRLARKQKMTIQFDSVQSTRHNW